VDWSRFDFSNTRARDFRRQYLWSAQLSCRLSLPLMVSLVRSWRRCWHDCISMQASDGRLVVLFAGRVCVPVLSIVRHVGLRSYDEGRHDAVRVSEGMSCGIETSWASVPSGIRIVHMRVRVCAWYCR
jgi:hypothetical protein